MEEGNTTGLAAMGKPWHSLLSEFVRHFALCHVASQRWTNLTKSRTAGDLQVTELDCCSWGKFARSLQTRFVGWLVSFRDGVAYWLLKKVGHNMRAENSNAGTSAEVHGLQPLLVKHAMPWALKDLCQRCIRIRSSDGGIDPPAQKLLHKLNCGTLPAGTPHNEGAVLARGKGAWWLFDSWEALSRNNKMSHS